MGWKLELKESSTGCGLTISFGSLFAIIASWSVNHSVLYALVHSVMSWVYVIYYVIFYGIT